MNGDKVRFCRDNQSVSLHPHGLNSSATAPAAPKMSRLVLASLVFMVVIIATSLMALFVVVLQKPRPAPEAYAYSQGLLGDNSTWQLPVEPSNPHRFGVAELQETLQMFKDHVENSSTWTMEIQMLMCRVDNVSSQIQMLGGHLKNASADIQMVKGVQKDASTLSFQAQMLKSSLDRASAEIQRQKGDLEKANALNSQAQSFLKTSLENTSFELNMLSTGLENANTEIQALKAGLEMANAQAQLANNSLKNANAQILTLRGNLESVHHLRDQNQVLSDSLERTNAEIQKLKGSLQNARELNSQTQTLIKGSLDNTTAEVQSLRGRLERAGNEIHLLKRDLGTATTQTQIANGRLEQTSAQIQGLKTELENTNALHSNIQVLNDQLENAGREIQILKQGMKDAEALNAKTRMLESKLQEANVEVQRLTGEVASTKALTAKVQEQQRSLETLRAAFASQEQLQKSQNELLQLILQGWKVYNRNMYYFSHVKKSWQEAEKSCVSQGAHLASVTSAEEQAYLTEFTRFSDYWIGLNDRGTEGFWRWIDGTPFSNARNRVFWNDNQPDNWQHGNGQDEDCVHVQQKWNDNNCNALYQWICKKPLSQGVA
ncbi:PREDICTED: C-type lectin domain family 4 member F isoform X1 [Myotis davidii]|uniref:C-type lectin domain family 4 member F isoform X2 n=2 Tax=Myotis davidii TaxID=225400 RepID=UPI000767A547|nr:PREDICTED: C-type lectin domain family 4 member F isoform X2 [Myotis davidii]XP_015426998.1 PREDICTED: C-type lectin domain family 4 member F isoform X1 [Myotis davidii]